MGLEAPKAATIAIVRPAEINTQDSLSTACGLDGFDIDAARRELLSDGPIKTVDTSKEDSRVTAAQQNRDNFEKLLGDKKDGDKTEDIIKRLTQPQKERYLNILGECEQALRNKLTKYQDGNIAGQDSIKQELDSIVKVRQEAERLIKGTTTDRVNETQKPKDKNAPEAAKVETSEERAVRISAAPLTERTKICSERIENYQDDLDNLNLFKSSSGGHVVLNRPLKPKAELDQALSDIKASCGIPLSTDIVIQEHRLVGGVKSGGLFSGKSKPAASPIPLSDGGFMRMDICDAKGGKLLASLEQIWPRDPHNPKEQLRRTGPDFKFQYKLYDAISVRELTKGKQSVKSTNQYDD